MNFQPQSCHKDFIEPLMKQQTFDYKKGQSVSTEQEEPNQQIGTSEFNSRILESLSKIGENFTQTDINKSDQPPKIKRSNMKKRTADSSFKKDQQNKAPSQSSLDTEKHVRIQSQKVIKFLPEIQAIKEQTQEKNPEDQLSPKNNIYIDLSKQFEYMGDFSIIRKVCAQIALENKLKIMQNTIQFLTLKTHSVGYCECILHSCFTFAEPAVYQLKSSLYKKNKAKFILIAGKQAQFQCFFKRMLERLWKKSLIKLNQKDAAVLVFDFAKGSSLSKTYKQFSQLNKQLSSSVIKSSKQEDKVNEHNFQINRTKISQQTLLKFCQLLKKNVTQVKKSLVCQERNFKYCLNQEVLEKQIEYKLYSSSQLPIWKLYTFLHHDQISRTSKRKQHILKQYSMRRIFSHLQLDEQFQLFLKHSIPVQQNTQKLQSTSKKAQIVQASCPYAPCIKILQSFCGLCHSNPKKALVQLHLFNKAMKTQYSQYYENHLQLANMDEELPITIYCFLMADLDSGFIGLIKWLSDYLSDEIEYSMERKILTTIQAAITFIGEEWKVDTSSLEQEAN